MLRAVSTQCDHAGDTQAKKEWSFHAAATGWSAVWLQGPWARFSMVNHYISPRITVQGIHRAQNKHNLTHTHKEKSDYLVTIVTIQ